MEVPKIKSSNNLIDNKYIKVREEDLEFDDGLKQDYFVVDSKNGSAILALTDDKKVVLARQYRHAVGKIILGLPGGGVETGEDYLETAKRELKEETGYAAKDFRELITYYPDPSQKSCAFRIFLATGLEKGEQELDESERIDVVLKDFDELYSEVASGKINESNLVIGVLLAKQKGF